MNSIKIYLSIIALCGINLFANSQTWYRQNPKLSTETLNDIDNSEMHFMAVGVSGAILSSTDIGETWSSKYPYPDQDLNGIKMINQNLAIAVGNQGTILRTTDKGANWNKINTPTSKNLNKVHFITNSLGLIVGNDGLILRTTNGGLSWTSINSGVSHHLNSVFFLDANRAYVVGNNGTFLRSADGGSTWTKINTSTSTNLTGVFFTSWDIGYIIGSYTFMRTVNGGDNWQRKSGGSEFNSCIKFKNANEGYIASGPFGRFYKCTNPLIEFNNVGWAQVKSSNESNDRLNGLAIFNDIIISVGSFGTIIKSTDSGKTWKQNDRGHIKAILSIDFFDESFGIAVGEEALLKTQDGGKTWVVDETFNDWFDDSDIFLSNIQYLNRNTIYVTGQYGNLVKTKDAGVSWFDIKTNVSGRWVKDCHFFDEMKGIIVGHEVIKRTINGGTSWLPINLPDNTTDDFWDIHFLNAERGFLAGDNGALYKTSTGGVTWERIPLSTSSTLTKINFLNQNVGYVIGNNGKVYRTENGGNSWKDVSISEATQLWDVKVVSTNDVYVTSPNEGLFTSKDGGNNWTLDSKQKGVFGVEFTNLGTGYISGLSGMIKTSKQILSSVEESEKEISMALKAYPNPTKGLLNIEAPEAASLIIYNISGVELAKFDVIEKSIDISHFENGIYFFKIFNSVGSCSLWKIIKH